MLVLKSFSLFSSQVPVQVGTVLLDWAMVNITVEELSHASSMWHHTYTNTMGRASAIAEIPGDSSYWHPAGYHEVDHDPPFSCERVKGLAQLLPIQSCRVQVIAEPIASQQVTWGSHGH